MLKDLRQQRGRLGLEAAGLPGGEFQKHIAQIGDGNSRRHAFVGPGGDVRAVVGPRGCVGDGVKGV